MNLSCFSFDIGENFVSEKRLVCREAPQPHGENEGSINKEAEAERKAHFRDLEDLTTRLDQKYGKKGNQRAKERMTAEDEAERTRRAAEEKLAKLAPKPAEKDLRITEKLLASIHPKLDYKFLEGVIEPLRATNKGRTRENLANDIARLQKQVGGNPDRKFGDETMLACLNYNGRDRWTLACLARMYLQLAFREINAGALRKQLTDKLHPPQKPAGAEERPVVARVSDATAPEAAPVETPAAKPQDALVLDRARQESLAKLRTELSEVMRETLARYAEGIWDIKKGERNEQLFRNGVLAAFREAGIKPPDRGITLVGITAGPPIQDQLAAKLDEFFARGRSLVRGEQLIANTEQMEIKRQAEIREADDKRLAKIYDLTFREVSGYMDRYLDAKASKEMAKANRILTDFTNFLALSLGLRYPTDINGLLSTLGNDIDRVARLITEDALEKKGMLDTSVANRRRAREVHKSYFAKN